MKKKIVSLLTLTIIALTMVAIPALSSTTAINSTQDEVLIKDTLYQYFDAKYKALGSLTEISLRNNYDSINNDMDINQEAINTDIGHRKKLPQDYGFKKYKFYLDYDSIKVSNNVAAVDLRESHDIWFNCITSEEPTQMANCVHKIKLIKKQGQWKIQKDDFFDWTKQELIEKVKKGKTPKEAKNLIVANSAVDYQANIDPKKIDAMNSNIVTALSLKTYYSGTAVQYADTWALSRNPAYKDYETLGGDCTNFTSQCLKAGSIPFDSSGSTDNLKWYWYSDTNRVPPWTGASQFNYYAKNNNTGSTSNVGLYAYTTLWGNMQPGDICQLTSSGTAYHSVFVVARVTDPILGTLEDYLIDCHTSNQKRYPLSLYTSSKEYIRIAGYY